jgi:hypothetical protein
MTILLDHVIVPSRDQDAGSRLLAQLLGVPNTHYGGKASTGRCRTATSGSCSP